MPSGGGMPAQSASPMGGAGYGASAGTSYGSSNFQGVGGFGDSGSSFSNQGGFMGAPQSAGLSQPTLFGGVEQSVQAPSQGLATGFGANISNPLPSFSMGSQAPSPSIGGMDAPSMPSMGNIFGDKQSPIGNQPMTMSSLPWKTEVANLDRGIAQRDYSDYALLSMGNPAGALSKFSGLSPEIRTLGTGAKMLGFGDDLASPAMSKLTPTDKLLPSGISAPDSSRLFMSKVMSSNPEMASQSRLSAGINPGSKLQAWAKGSGGQDIRNNFGDYLDMSKLQSSFIDNSDFINKLGVDKTQAYDMFNKFMQNPMNPTKNFINFSQKFHKYFY
jgi:hypothetical protein